MLQPIKYLATEPLGNMLGVIKEKQPEVLTLQCAAHALPLPDASAKVGRSQTENKIDLPLWLISPPQ